MKDELVGLALSHPSVETADCVTSEFHFGSNCDPYRGDGSVWEFGRDTATPDITAWELLQVANISISVPDGIMDRIKKNPAVLRHFRRVSPL